MKYLILGPGGQGLFIMLGYLKKIEHQLKDVEEISGASAGALLAFGLATGKTLDEILNFSINIDIESHIKIQLKNLLKNFGFIDTVKIKETLIQIVGYNPRFKDLKIKLHISAMCLNTSSTVYFSADTHPDMYVVDAVCASISIPLIFIGYKYQDGIYIDGGTLEEVPALPFLHKNADDVFCIQIKVQKPQFEKITDIRIYIKNLITAGFLSRINYPQIKRILLECDMFDLLNAKLSVEDKLRLFMLGQK